jgi:hypothetical protein
LTIAYIANVARNYDRDREAPPGPETLESCQGAFPLTRLSASRMRKTVELKMALTHSGREGSD